MVETHVRFFVPAVDPLPLKIFAPVNILLHLFKGRRFGDDELMAAPARVDAGYFSHRPRCDALMTVHALHLNPLDMDLVCVGEGLNGFGTDAEEVPDGLPRGAVCRRENTLIEPGPDS